MDSFHQRMFSLHIRKNFFTEMVVKYCKRLPKQEVEPQSLEVFKMWWLEMWFSSEHSGAGLTIRLKDLRDLFQS